jgi:hypothetical protein
MPEAQGASLRAMTDDERITSRDQHWATNLAARHRTTAVNQRRATSDH